MQIYLTYILAPLVGGIIGYITNDIAIRMLFRPHTAKYVFGYRVPFTPGLIPKEKGRIADAIGVVISENLMNSEVLQKYLLSEEMLTKINTAISDFFEKQKSNAESVREFLLHYVSEEDIVTIVQSLQTNLSDQFKESLDNPVMGDKIAHLAMDRVAFKLNENGASELISSGLGGIMGGLGGAAIGLLGSGIVGRFLAQLREPAEKYLAKNINEMLHNDGRVIVSDFIDSETENFLCTPISKLFSNKDEQLSSLHGSLVSAYKRVVEEHLPVILNSVDISKIVRDRINDMNVEETEKLILLVMNKELKSIVWLGALLGSIIGSINLFF